MIDEKVASKIHDEAREKIAPILLQVFNDGFVLGEIGMGGDKETVDAALDQILSILGTTDIECPECKGKGWYSTFVVGWGGYGTNCSKCDKGVIKHKWKIAVVLENGELPTNPYTSISTPTDRWLGYGNAKKDMLDEGWVKEVRQVVE